MSDPLALKELVSIRNMVRAIALLELAKRCREEGDVDLAAKCDDEARTLIGQG
jgi:hypothetical protein